jgi:hypothetical protein
MKTEEGKEEGPRRMGNWRTRSFRNRPTRLHGGLSIPYQTPELIIVGSVVPLVGYHWY